jgi:hypothetical protein
MTAAATSTQDTSSAPRLAIMQPYLFPYLGYFQLIDASSRFIFYDDVHYITSRGWINRNRILVNGRDFLFSAPVTHASHRALINETTLAIDDRWRGKFKRTLESAYRRAPHFAEVEPLVTAVLAAGHDDVSELAIHSITAVLDYLQLPFAHTRSSICAPDTRGLGRAERLFAIIRSEGYSRYVNSAGGEGLYSKAEFAAQGIELRFLHSGEIGYRQFSDPFVAGLSIIDVLMFNAPSVVRGFMKQYTLD